MTHVIRLHDAPFLTVTEVTLLSKSTEVWQDLAVTRNVQTSVCIKYSSVTAGYPETLLFENMNICLRKYLLLCVEGKRCYHKNVIYVWVISRGFHHCPAPSWDEQQSPFILMGKLNVSKDYDQLFGPIVTKVIFGPIFQRPRVFWRFWHWNLFERK